MIGCIHGNRYKKNTTGCGFLSGAAARTGMEIKKRKKKIIENKEKDCYKK